MTYYLSINIQNVQKGMGKSEPTSNTHEEKRNMVYNYHWRVYVPLPEILEQHPWGESFSADTDSLQHTITSELMQHEVTINQTGFLLLVGDDASHEMRGGVSQGGQQISQLLFVTETDSLESRALAFARLWNV